jgi:hypothetical protein
MFRVKIEVFDQAASATDTFQLWHLMHQPGIIYYMTAESKESVPLFICIHDRLRYVLEKGWYGVYSPFV